MLASALSVGACTEPTGRRGSPTPSVSEREPAVSVARADRRAPRRRHAASRGMPERGRRVPDRRVRRRRTRMGARPRHERAACLFPVEDAGPFSWGPQGDRVLLGGFEVRGVGGDAPRTSPAIATSVGAFDWGHPLGLAVAFADGKGNPRKRFIDDGHLEKLTTLPPGSYLQVAYHPSGLALSFVVEKPKRARRSGFRRTRARIRNDSIFSKKGNDLHLARLLAERRDPLVDRPAPGRLSRAPFHAPRHAEQDSAPPGGARRERSPTG